MVKYQYAITQVDISSAPEMDIDDSYWWKVVSPSPDPQWEFVFMTSYGSVTNIIWRRPTPQKANNEPSHP